MSESASHVSQTQYGEAKHRLLEEVRDAEIINFTVPVIRSALAVLESSPVRAMDALHIACTLEWGAQLFVSSDKNQLRAARRAGIRTQEV